MAYREKVTIVRADEIATDIYEMCFSTKNIAKEAKPGQFVSVYSNDGSRLLPRPISICGIEGDTLRIVYRAIGKGTQEFATMHAGQILEVQGPLGNGYDISKVSKERKAILFGGGIGIPPMLELAKQLDCEKSIVLGYRDELFLNDEFEAYGKVYLATEDGSAGTKGTVIDAMKENELNADVIFACGPKPMLRAIKEFAAKKQIPCFISLEERMACGIGACLACVCQTKNVDGHSNVHNARVCKDGPVFAAEEVTL